MLRQQLPKEENRNALASFKILDDELIGLLSGKFSGEDYYPDFDFDKAGKKIEKLKPIKVEEIRAIEADLNNLKPEEKENRIKEPNFTKFKLEKEEIKIMKPEADQSEKVQRVKLTQPKAPSQRPQTLNLPESPNDLGHIELDLVARDEISKEVKLIKSLAEKFSTENKSSPKEAPSLKQKPEKTASPPPRLKNEKLKTENESLPELKEKPKYPKPQKVQTEAKPSVAPKEADNSSSLDFQYDKTEESALGIPFDAFDLSDFKLDDIIDENIEEADDILNDQDLLTELYGDGSDPKKAVDALEKEEDSQSLISKSFHKSSTAFHDKLNAIIEDTITETIENSLNDLLPEIVERIIYKKFNR